jgi:hypothetical protein
MGDKVVESEAQSEHRGKTAFSESVDSQFESPVGVS